MFTIANTTSVNVQYAEHYDNDRSQVVREDEAESLEEHAGTSKINYQSR